MVNQLQLCVIFLYFWHLTLTIQRTSLTLGLCLAFAYWLTCNPFLVPFVLVSWLGLPPCESFCLAPFCPFVVCFVSCLCISSLWSAMNVFIGHAVCWKLCVAISLLNRCHCITCIVFWVKGAPLWRCPFSVCGVLGQPPLYCSGLYSCSCGWVASFYCSVSSLLICKG